ncbi:MAG: hydrogenase formation protein HypD [Bacteroidota bacterium]
MRFADEYRDQELVLSLSEKIHRVSKKPVAFMEVCGGHTMAVHRYGLHALLPATVKLLSGPGCPVCVTATSFIDTALELSRIPSNIITTFGDLIRVPGTFTSLEKERMNGGDIRIVYSILDAIALAHANPAKNIIFLGIGFETTAPATAAGIKKAALERLSNFSVLSSHKIMPPVMEALINEGVKLNGYIAPGHVSAITGSSIYNKIAEVYRLGVVISGFEPADILQSILMLVEQVENDRPAVEIAYKRVVKHEGNLIAQQLLNDIFEPADDWWRGFGIIPGSGLKIRQKYEEWDAIKKFPVNIPIPKEPKGCICGDILKGVKTPKECPLFGKVCNPENPVGACMVSGEGSCGTWFKYHGGI